jgi:hypothetical protein
LTTGGQNCPSLRIIGISVPLGWHKFPKTSGYQAKKNSLAAQEQLSSMMVPIEGGWDAHTFPFLISFSLSNNPRGMFLKNMYNKCYNKKAGF